MGLIRRVSDVFSANLHELVETYEDPEKMLRHAVREMEATLHRALNAAARALANEKLLGKQITQHGRQIEHCRKTIDEAISRGDDAAARQAITRRREHEKLLEVLETQFHEAQETNRTLRRQIETMRMRLAEARRKLASLSARKQLATARKKFASDASGFALVDDAFSRFDRMQEKIEQEEAEAEALIQLTASEPLCSSSHDEEVEAELEELKRSR